MSLCLLYDVYCLLCVLSLDSTVNVMVIVPVVTSMFSSCYPWYLLVPVIDDLSCCRGAKGYEKKGVHIITPTYYPSFLPSFPPIKCMCCICDGIDSRSSEYYDGIRGCVCDPFLAPECLYCRYSQWGLACPLPPPLMVVSTFWCLRWSSLCTLPYILPMAAWMREREVV